MVKRRRVRIEIGTAVKDFESEVENVERLNTDKSIPDRNVMDQNKDSSDDILEGLDLEGVSEQEKEEIKRALIASRQDHLPGSVVSKEAGFRDGRPRQNTQEEEGQNGPENIKIDALNSYEELIEGKMISKDNKVQDVNPDDPIDDDDETQPPSDQENHLDLSRNTLQMEDDTAYICNTDDDDTSVHRRHRSPYPVPQQRNMEMDFDVSAEQPSVDESVSILVDDTEAQELENMEQGSPESGGLSPKAEVPRSAESQSSQGSQRSNYEGEGSGKMGDEGQKCEEIQDYRVESDHQEAYQENPADSLYRHYRAVTFQARQGPQYFTVEGMTTVQCAKAIFQLFETYRRKLKEAQQKLPEKMTYGNPIKSGRPKLETLDVRKRGRAPIIIDLSDDEDFDNEMSDKGVKTGTKRKAKVTDDTELKKEKNVNSNCDNIDDDFVNAESNSQGDCKGKPFPQKNVPVVTKTAEKTCRLGRNRKKIAPVLVEETQPPETQTDNDDFGVNFNYIIEETQNVVKDDDEWLSIKRQLGKQEFEHSLQKAKLKGYSIPRRGDSKRMDNLQKSPKSSMTRKSQPKNIDLDTSKTSAETEATATRGRKRKPIKEPVTLVEDTQDMNEESDSKVYKDGGVRKKRKCFRLSSDDESVPETQGLDDSPDVTVIEEDSPEPQTVHIKDREKIKSAESGKDSMDDNENSETNLDHESIRYCKLSSEANNPEEGSQSPVIKRSRLTCRSLSKSNGNNMGECISYDKEKKTDIVSCTTIEGGSDKNNIKAFSDIKANVIESRTHKTGRGVNRLNGQPESKDGVNRLTRRPESKESNASDDMSMSSQISNTMIDESGDLYSTQMCEALMRRNKNSLNQNVKKNDETRGRNVVDKVDVGLNTDSDDDDVRIVKEVKGNLKTYNRSKTAIGKFTQNQNTVGKDKNIDDFLTHHKDRSKSNIDIDDLNNSAHLISEQSDIDNTDLNLSGLHDWNKSSCQKTRSKETLVTIHMDESSFSVKPKNYIVPLQTVKARQCSTPKIETVTLSSLREDTAQNRKSPRLTKPLLIENQNTNQPITMQGTILHDHENDQQDDFRPIKMQDFMSHNQDCDIMISNKPTTKRQRTRNRSGTVARLGNDMEIAAYVKGGARGGARGGGRRDRELEEEPVIKAIKKEEVGVECPLCSISFPKSVIEEHASNCDGTVPDLGHQSPEVHYGGDQDGAVGGAHVPMPGACNFPVELQDESDEDPLAEEEHTSGGEVEDTDVQDVIKDIKNSPGEEGQCEQCYICDEYCLKGQPFDQHLAQCMLKAKQQQAKVDSKGYEQAFTPQRHEQPADVRQTRRQVRHKQQDEEEEPVSVEKPMLNRRRQLYKRPSSATSTADRYITAIRPREAAVSESEVSADISSWEDGSSSGSVSSEEDDNITLGSIARAGSPSLINGPWNTSQPETQPDGSHTIPNWLKNSASSPIKSFVPVSMQKDSEYFKKQFKYNEERIAKKQLKRKRKQSQKSTWGRRKKRRRVKKKKT